MRTNFAAETNGLAPQLLPRFCGMCFRFRCSSLRFPSDFFRALPGLLLLVALLCLDPEPLRLLPFLFRFLLLQLPVALAVALVGLSAQLLVVDLTKRHQKFIRHFNLRYTLHTARPGGRNACLFLISNAF